MAGGVDAEQLPRPIGAELLADQGEDERLGDALDREFMLLIPDTVPRAVHCNNADGEELPRCPTQERDVVRHLAFIVSTVAKEADYDMRAFHVPKTVDNDLLVTDHCPGYGSAAKFVACALMGDDLDNRALPGVKIDVIMGRHAGFLTAAAALAKKRDDDGPHLIYIPERPVSMDKFLADVNAVYKKLGRCVIAVSEGICDTDGTVWTKKIADTGEKDAHNNIQLSGTGALADFLDEAFVLLGGVAGGGLLVLSHLGNHVG
jgi:6-phosphofructokinase